MIWNINDQEYLETQGFNPKVTRVELNLFIMTIVLLPTVISMLIFPEGKEFQDR
jgi:hypothetical protein